jgi:hypothetical protein
VRRQEGKGRRRGYCVAARGGARGSTQRVFVRQRRGEEGMRRRRGCVRRRTRWRPRECQARRRRGFTASGGATTNRTAAPSSVGSVKSSRSARFGSQTGYIRQLASRSGKGISDGVVCDYCMFAQGKIIRFSIAHGDLQSKGLRTAFQMHNKRAPGDSMLKC